MSNTPKIDEILDKVFTKLQPVDISENGEVTYHESKPFINQITEAKDQLYQLILEVIGEDDTEIGHSKVNGSNPVLYFGHRNELKAEQRQKLSDLFGKVE